MVKKNSKYNKILVANRGEIACRIIKTISKMGISSVAIYSDADINSLHVKNANDSRYIGPSVPYLSYLNIEKICQVAIETGSQAVHPGYGFLSENPNFLQELQKYNIDFIGPSIETMKVTSNKIIAKEFAKKSGVDIVPGYIGEVNDITNAINIAEDIGFPVILKAVSGGGGKGIRIVKSKDEIESAFISVKTESEKNFKDSALFVEKYIELPRHIEIQIIADKYGNVVCLGERECSIQRNNQKIIEESPSPFISDKIRCKIYNQCVSLAKQVGYFSAGTIEFIVDQKQNFFFLEINTRLQVEHPVTEFITGLDIVEEMIRISCGEKLRFNQNDIKLTGYAIESRICAEDPSRNFYPSSGKIKYYDKPSENDYVRIDDGVYAGSEISMFYDSMIAKLITYGKDRIEAISKMQKALSEFYISGVINNIEFLESIFHNPNFIAARLYTGFISENYPSGFRGDYITEEYIKIFIFATLYIYLENEKKYYNKKSIDGLFIVKINHNEYCIKARYHNNILTTIYNHNTYFIIGNWKLSYKLLYITINSSNTLAVKVERQNIKHFIKYAGMKAECCVLKPYVAVLNKLMINNVIKENISVNIIKSPISGLLVKLNIDVGDEVMMGQPLFTVESMKMENIICAEFDMIIKNIYVREGDNLEINDSILDFNTTFSKVR